MKLLHMAIFVALAIGISTKVVQAQTELHCPDFRFEPQPAENLPGKIVYLAASGFDVLNANSHTVRSFSIDTEYMTISPNGRWLIEEKWVDGHVPGSLREYWMIDLEGDSPPRLLLSSPHPAAKAVWLDDERLVFRWGTYPIDEYHRNVLILPFEDPVQYIEMATYIDDWLVMSFALNLRYLLLWKAQEYAVYDVQTGNLETLAHYAGWPIQVRPDWSFDSRLAYPASTGIDEAATGQFYRYYEEIFVANLTTGNTRQLTHFQHTYGIVDISRQMVWSPDGNYVAFKMSRFDLPPDEWLQMMENTQFPIGSTNPGDALYVLNVNTDEVIPLCVEPNDSSPEHLFWSPDSQYIAFSYGDNLVVVQVETRAFSIVEKGVSFVMDWK